MFPDYLWAVALAYVLYKIMWFYSSTYRLRHIPTVGGGSGSIFSYYWAATRFVFNSRAVLQEGYDKYRGAAFKIAKWDRWHVLVSGREMIEDIRRAKDEQLSFLVPTFESLQFVPQMGPEVFLDPYHIEVIRTDLTKNIAAAFPELHDEVVTAFNDEMPATKEWFGVQPTDVIRRIISRTSNRLFVGLPLCRDPVYRDLNVHFTVYLALCAEVLRLFPEFLRPYISQLTPVPRKIRQAENLLAPFLKERLELDAKYGSDWDERPNDVLSWLLKGAAPSQKTLHDLTLRILAINFATVHTSATTVMCSLHYLAAHPEYIPALREEIETAIDEDRWTKKAVDKMRKLDSFIRESQRLSSGIGCVALIRLAMQDFTFSNGLTVPAGTMVATPAYGIHTDEEILENAQEFRPFRSVSLSWMILPTRNRSSIIW